MYVGYIAVFNCVQSKSCIDKEPTKLSTIALLHFIKITMHVFYQYDEVGS